MKKSEKKIINDKIDISKSQVVSTPSSLSPETEKRLLGNLKAPKRNYSSTGKPKPIERIEIKTFTPPKAAENLSKLTSIQQFQKDFNQLEGNVQKLHQISSPQDCKRMFDAVAEIKDSMPIFKNHCKKIAKQKKLNAPVSQVSFDFYKDYAKEFEIFVQRMVSFYDQIHNIYSHAIIQLFQDMDQSAAAIFDACNKDPQARSLLLQYRKYCDESMKRVDQALVTYLEDTTFSSFTTEQIDKIAETAKTFGRFFERDLYPALLQCIPNNQVLPSSIQIFHKSYIQLIPLITCAPNFVLQFNEVLHDLDILQKDMKMIKREVGDESILKKTNRVQISEPNNSNPDFDDEKEDFSPALRALAAYFDMEVDLNKKTADILDEIQSAARKTVNELKSKIKSLEEQMNKPEGVPKDMYKKQLTDIRAFKKELEQKVNAETDSFCRSVIYSIKSLIPDAKIDPTISYVRQIQYINNELRAAFQANSDNALKYQEQIEATKEFLKQFKVDPNQNLDKMVKSAFEQSVNNMNKANDQIKSLKDAQQKIKSDLIEFISSSFGVDQPKLITKDVKELLNDAKSGINNVTNEIKRSRAESAQIIQSYMNSRDSIAKLLNVEPSGLDVDGLESDFAKLEKQIQIKTSNDVIFQQNVFVFIKKMSDALSLNIYPSDPSKEEINLALSGILKAVDKSDDISIKILNNQPETGIFKIQAMCYKYFLQLYCMITSEKLALNPKQDIKIMFETAFRKFTEIKSENIRDSFGDLISLEQLTTNRSATITKLHDEVVDSRIMKEQLSKLHKVINSITTQLVSDEMTFIPGTKQLETLASISASLLVLRNEREIVSNVVIQDIADMNNSLCQLISDGKFSPERTRALLVYQNELKEIITQLRNGNPR